MPLQKKMAAARMGKRRPKLSSLVPSESADLDECPALKVREPVWETVPSMAVDVDGCPDDEGAILMIEEEAPSC